jgi:hypothetical protein
MKAMLEPMMAVARTHGFANRGQGRAGGEVRISASSQGSLPMWLIAGRSIA